MPDMTGSRSCIALGLMASLLLAACGPTPVTPIPSPSTAALTPGTATHVVPSPSEPPASTSPVPDITGFAFAADDVLTYYRTQGYECAGPQTSANAVGYSFQTCQQVDETGRTRVVGVVTDPNGGLADGFASVHGNDSETILAPVDALDPLAGFLGAMLGEEQGAALLTWLAGHLGDTYAETTSGSIRVATYVESVDDQSTLYVEVANPAYLAAPAPSGP